MNGLIVLLSALNLLTALLHGLGCYLLTFQYKEGHQTSQQLFLINLAVSEGAANFLQLLTNQHVTLQNNSTSLFIIHKCQHYIITFRGYGVVTVYFLTMIYMTLDKFFDIFLNIYGIMCTGTNTKQRTY